MANLTKKYMVIGQFLPAQEGGFARAFFRTVDFQVGLELTFQLMTWATLNGVDVDYGVTATEIAAAVGGPKGDGPR